MKNPSRLLAGLSAFFLAGCMQLDLTPEGDPNRVITGTVNLRMPTDLPADASVLVRVVEANHPEKGKQVLGEQAIARAAVVPVPYRVEFRADDAVLRRGLNVEARISFGGGLRYYNVNAVAVNLGNFDRPVVVVVDPVVR